MQALGGLEEDRGGRGEEESMGGEENIKGGPSREDEGELAKRKKEDIEHITKWRKQRQDSGFARGGDEELSFGFDDDKGFERSKKRRSGVAPGDRSGGFSRQRESQFGHGGRKGMNKQNTSGDN